MKRQNQNTLPPSAQNATNRQSSVPAPSSYYWWPITEAKIESAVHKIADSIHPDKIILFGSFSSGTPTPDSDVDLLVVMESAASIRERAIKVSEILYPRPFPLDVITRTPAELQERLEIGDCFFEEIVTKGKVLYERVPS